MDLQFVPMTTGQAQAIVDQWKYPGEYSIYDYSNEADHILDPAAWGVGLFAVLDRAGRLVGEVSIEFSDESGQVTEYEQFSDDLLINSRELWIGFGLRPDLVGCGHGAEFVVACVRFAVAELNYRGEYVRLGVAQFNKRAIEAYRKAGFETYEQANGLIAGKEYACVHMRLAIERGRDNPAGAQQLAEADSAGGRKRSGALPSGMS